jgi:hypothetical protein
MVSDVDYCLLLAFAIERGDERANLAEHVVWIAQEAVVAGTNQVYIPRTLEPLLEGSRLRTGGVVYRRRGRFLGSSQCDHELTSELDRWNASPEVKVVARDWP